MEVAVEARVEAQGRTAAQLFWSFLGLGLTSFGGPVAHLGYFRNAFVARKRWLTDTEFVDLVALCQFLPGPASSQVAFGIGMKQAGVWGGLAAWFAFTLPSALLMFGFAQFAGRMGGPVETAILHGLKVVAVAIVAHAVWSMGRSQAPDRPRLAIAAVAAVLALSLTVPLSQLLIIVLGGVAGLVLCKPGAALPQARGGIQTSPRLAAVLLGLFVVLLVAGPFASAFGGSLALFQAYYRTGALVFGGGHVVLPLLQSAVVLPGWVSADAFLAGYGAAQALPGPLFSLAAYLGAIANRPPNGVAGAVIALAGISLPGLLLVAGLLPFWDKMRAAVRLQAMVQGINACVVGILAAALYNPLWISAMDAPADIAIALAGFALLLTGRVPVLLIVALITGVETLLALA